jgi:hypothetical protein
MTTQTFSPTLLITYISKPMIGNYTERNIISTQIHKALYRTFNEYQDGVDFVEADLYNAFKSNPDSIKRTSKGNLQFFINKFSDRIDKQPFVSFLESLKQLISL